MKAAWTSPLLALAFALCEVSALDHPSAAAELWPARSEDQGSIIVVLEPDPDLAGGAAVLTLAGRTGLIDATPWHQPSQPFVKQYLVEPGFYVVHGSANFEPTKLEAGAGKALLLTLEVEEPRDAELNYEVSVSSLEDIDLDDARSRVVDLLAAHKGALQIYASSLRTEGNDLRFDLESVSEYLPLPRPVPRPIPNPSPGPSPPPQDMPQ